MAKQKRTSNRPKPERRTRPVEAELIPDQPTKTIQLRPQQTAIQTRTTPTLAELKQRAADTIELYTAIVTLIAANVRPSQMTVYGNVNDLTSCQVHYSNDACKKVLKWINAEFQLGEMEEKDYECPVGPAREFVQHATVWDEHGRETSVVGNRSTYDEFFSRRSRYLCPKCKAEGKETVLSEFECSVKEHGKIKEGAIRQAYDLPMTEVDIPSVRQAAISNTWNKALAAVGYLPAVEDLIKAGVVITTLRCVSFDRGKEGGKMKEEDSVEHASMRAEAAKLLEELSNKDRAKYEAILLEATAFKDFKGHRSLADVSQKQLPFVLEKLKKLQKPGEAKTEQTKAPTDKAEVGKGVVTEIETKTKSGGGPYLKLKQGGNMIYCFKDTAIQDPALKPTTYHALLKAIALNVDCEFEIEFSNKDNQPYNTLKTIKRIGAVTWTDGVPDIQRGAELFPSSRQPGE